ncbi:Hypothetical_protein [Hexamita inflata]|uniref:Hypothetical_protein n=1 Tax=Hexamita inflata TaxID=28002 RepID=A0AA86N8S1_9EUKA|nr:Hypothetical protein HINF_LOCUS2798 [Hexamita inflata]CAI9915155.1 Hypothetical protein HINF_LOCUS2800 [Hexamita inflata]CAI9915157.1 Hypothetical protein HINF_LOCUS2802 [Hexamita inflata]
MQQICGVRQRALLFLGVSSSSGEHLRFQDKTSTAFQHFESSLCFYCVVINTLIVRKQLNCQQSFNLHGDRETAMAQTFVLFVQSFKYGVIRQFSRRCDNLALSNSLQRQIAQILQTAAAYHIISFLKLQKEQTKIFYLRPLQFKLTQQIH